MNFSFLPAFLTVFPLNHTPRAVSVRRIFFVFTIAYFARYFKMVRHILYILRVFCGSFSSNSQRIFSLHPNAAQKASSERGGFRPPLAAHKKASLYTREA
jgi:hypothetical protein